MKLPRCPTCRGRVEPFHPECQSCGQSIEWDSRLVEGTDGSPAEDGNHYECDRCEVTVSGGTSDPVGRLKLLWHQLRDHPERILGVGT